MVAAFKSVGALGITTGTSLSVPVPAAVAGDYGVMNVFVAASETPPTIAGWAVALSESNGGGGAMHLYWRAFTGTVAGHNASITVPAGGAYGKVVLASDAGTGAPDVVLNALDGSNSHWQTAPLGASAAPRFAAHFAFINGVRTQGSLSNQGTITATNTSRAFEDLLGAYRLETATSAITSVNGGSVRGTFTGGNISTLTFTAIVPEPPLAPPTGLDLTAGAGELGVSFNAVSGADAYEIRYRQTGLSAPSPTTQTSAPAHLARVDDVTPGANTTYVYTWSGAGVRVFICDTGVRYTHNEFTGRTLPGGSLGETAYDDDVANHGTGAAGVALGTLYGVAKGATLLAVQVMDDPGGSASPMELSAAGVTSVADFVLENLGSGGAVVNFSLALQGLQEGTADVPAVRAQLTRLLDAGVMVMVAAGNFDLDITSRLALADPRIIWGSSSVPDTDARAYEMPYGPSNLIFTPVGVEGHGASATTASAASDSASRSYGSTSGAAPMIAGVAAKNLQANPHLSAARVQEVILSQARQGIVTDVPAGPNNLLNSNSIITDWTLHPMAGTTGTLDGLGPETGWEIQVRAISGGVPSEWSSTEAGTTEGEDSIPEGTFATSYSFGPATAMGESPVVPIPEGVFAASYAFGPATAQGESPAIPIPEGAFATSYTFGPAEATGRSPLVPGAGGAFTTSYSFGPAAVAGHASAQGGFAGAYTFGPAEAAGESPLVPGAGGAFATSYAFGPAEAAGHASAEGSFATPYSFGPATAAGESPLVPGAGGVFVTSYAFGPATASGVAPVVPGYVFIEYDGDAEAVLEAVEWDGLEEASLTVVESG